MKKIFSFALAALMIFAMITAAFAAERDASAIIADMLKAYQSSQEGASGELAGLEQELAAADGAMGEAWSRIMDYWAWVNTKMTVNRGVLPDGLPEDGSLCIIVLGYQLNPDGTMQEELLGRLQVALASAKKYPSAYIACTGGGTASNNPAATEADQMAAWLVAQGIAPARILVENQSRSTVENAEFTYQILREEYPQIETLALVTSDYHVPRGCLLYNATLILAAYEAGDAPLTIADNAGFETGREGYESISLQASGLAQVAGVNLGASSEEPGSAVSGELAGGASPLAAPSPAGK